MASQPPNTQAFYLHVLHTQFQICFWKAALNPDPPIHDPAEYGRKPLHQDQTLHHVPLSSHTASPAEAMVFLLHRKYVCFQEMHIQQIMDNM